MIGVLYKDMPSDKEDGNGWVIGESGDIERQLEWSEFEESFQSKSLNLAPGNASFLRRLFSQPSCESSSKKKNKPQMSVILETHQAPRTGKHWESGKVPN